MTAAAQLLRERLSNIELRIIATMPRAGVDIRAVAAATGLAPDTVRDATIALVADGVLSTVGGDRVGLIPDIGELLREGQSSAGLECMAEVQMQRCRALSKLLAAPDLAEFPGFAEWAAERIVDEGPAIAATLAETAVHVSELNRQVYEQFLELTERCPDWPELRISMRPVLAVAAQVGDSVLVERTVGHIEGGYARRDAAPIEVRSESIAKSGESVRIGLEQVRVQIPIVEGPGSIVSGPIYFGHGL